MVNEFSNVVNFGDPSVDYTEDGGANVSYGPETPFVDSSINLVQSISKIKSAKYPSFHNEDRKLSGEDILKEIGMVCVDDYKIDLASRSEWEKNTSKVVKLFNAFVEKKDYPWKGASNIILPTLSIATLQFQARAYDALIPSKEIVKVVSFQDANIERAERVQKYMNYQLMYKMENFEGGMDKTLMQLPIEGSVFKKTFYDAVLGRCVSEYVSAFDFVVNYGSKDLESASRKTHVLYMMRNDIRRRVDRGIFTKDAWELGVSAESNTSEIKIMADKVEGRQDPSDSYNKPRMILEQHRFWDLDGDGIEEPYVVTVDLETDLVLRIVSRGTVDKPREYFTEYTFLPNPEGIYGLGFGTLLRGLNEASNAIVNQVIDAGSLQNLQGGFFLRKSGLKSQQLTFGMGEFKAVDAYVDDIRKALIHFDFKGPSGTLYSVLGLLYEYSKLVSGVSETMTGQMPAGDTPATTMLSVIEEGRKVLSSIHKRIHRSFKKELTKLYLLNEMYLDEEEYQQIVQQPNQQGQAQQGQAPQEPVSGKQDFAGNHQIAPVSDPTITSRTEKIVKAQQVVQDIRSNPLTANNAKANYEATKRFYEALDVANIEELLQETDPPDLSPEEEGAGFLAEKPGTVLPKQDHGHHIEVHQALLQGPFGEQLTSVGKKLLDQHMREHIAQMYLQSQQGQQQGQQQGAYV